MYCSSATADPYIGTFFPKEVINGQYWGKATSNKYNTGIYSIELALKDKQISGFIYKIPISLGANSVSPPIQTNNFSATCSYVPSQNSKGTGSPIGNPLLSCSGSLPVKINSIQIDGKNSQFERSKININWVLPS